MLLNLILKQTSIFNVINSFLESQFGDVRVNPFQEECKHHLMLNINFHAAKEKTICTVFF